MRLVLSPSAAGLAGRQSVRRRPLRILLVDDHTLLRSGLKALLSVEFQGAAFGEAADGPEVILRQPAHKFTFIVSNRDGQHY